METEFQGSVDMNADDEFATDFAEVEKYQEQVAPEKSYEEKLEASNKLLAHNNVVRPILYRILKTCESSDATLTQLEEMIQTQPEYTKTTPPAYFLIQWLVENYALAEYPLDGDGKEILEDDTVDLTEDEIDDLIETWAYRITDVGRATIEEFSPSHKLIDLFKVIPERYDTYIEVLEFLCERRSFAEVDKLLRGRDILRVRSNGSSRPMSPSVFVDKLAAAGGIAYNNGWMITEEGRGLLEELRMSEN